MKTIGMFLNLEKGSESDLRLDKFKMGVKDTFGTFETDWKFVDPIVYGKGEYHTYQNSANGLVATNPKPDLLFASCGPSLRALQIALAQDTARPIVYGGVIDPENSDVLLPGYTRYGVTSYKLSDLRKMVKYFVDAPSSVQIKKLGVIWDPKTRIGPAQLGFISGGVPSHYAVEGISIRDPKLKTRIDNLASGMANAGLIVVATTYTAVKRDNLITIVNDAEDNNRGFRALFPNWLYVRKLARWSWGPKTLEYIGELGRIAGRVLKGESPPSEENYDPEDHPHP